MLKYGNEVHPEMDFIPRPPPPDPLHALPGQYWDSGSVRDFMEAAAPWIMQYCSRRLSSDPDIVGDFFVHFYERAETCLEKYKSRRHIPFTGYLATYLRHEYSNFMRPRRYNRVAESAVGDIHEPVPPDYGAWGTTGSDERAKHLDVLNERLMKLALELRLPVKLHYGLNLNRTELRAVVDTSHSPARAAEFLFEFNLRREAYLTRMARLRHRAHHLNYLIHSNPRRPGIKAGPEKWKRWKHRILKVLESGGGILTMAEIGELLGVNRSTISRRIEKAEIHLKAGHV